MDGKILKWLFLAAVVLLQVGCATETKTPDDDAAYSLQPVPSRDDSHGWGANLQNAPR